MRPRDMLKIGMLLAGDGVWAGRRIIGADWVAALTTGQSTIRDTPYGYFFWLRYLVMGDAQRIETPQLSGNGGQKVILLREQNTIVVMTAGNFNQPSNANELLSTFIIDGLP